MASLLLFLLALTQETPAGLVEKLRSSRIEDREEAAEGLRRMGAPALPALDRLASDSDPEVRAVAATIARSLRLESTLTPKLKRAFPDLTHHLATGVDRRWTEVFLEAVADVSTSTEEGTRFEAKHPGLERRDLEPLAAAALRGARDGEERSRLLREFGSRSLRVALSDLVRLLKHGDSDVRSLVVSALGSRGAPEAMDLLRPCLGDTDPRVSQEAAAVLAALGDRTVIPLLIDMILAPGCDGNCIRTAHAARGLGRLEVRESVPRFLAALGSPEWHVRNHAVQALGALGEEEAVPQLLRLRLDEEGNVAYSARNALRVIGGKQAVEAFLQDLAGEERLNAAGTLGSMGDPRAIPALLPLLRDKDPGVRTNAAFSLASLRATEAVAHLHPLLKEEPLEVRLAAFQALARLGEASVVPAGLALMKEGDYWDRKNVAIALCRLGVREAVPSLLEECQALANLNAVRRPVAWARLRGKQARLRGPSDQVLAALAEEAGLALEWVATTRGELARAHLNRGWLPPADDLADHVVSLENLLDGRVHIVLEDDRLRVLPCEEGHAFWGSWWRKESGK